MCHNHAHLEASRRYGAPKFKREAMIKRSLRKAILPAALLATTLLGGCYYPYGYGGGYYGYGYPGYYGYGYPGYVGTGVVIGGWGWRGGYGCCGYGWRGGYGWGGGWRGGAGWHGGGGGWHGGGGGWHH